MWEVVDQKGNHRAIKVVCKSNIRTKKNKTKVSKRYTGLLFSERGVVLMAECVVVGRDKTASNAQTPPYRAIRRLLRG